MLKLLYFFFFQGTPTADILDAAIPILGANAMGNNAIPPVALINLLGLRFCVIGLDAGFEPGVDCCPPQQNQVQAYANRHYRRQLLAIAYAVLGGAPWVEPLWAKHCQSPSLNSVVGASGCWKTWPAPAMGNYLLNPSSGTCFKPNQHAWVALACCSPAAYKLLAPVNLAELRFLAEGGTFGPGYGMWNPIPSKSVWAMLARNIVIMDLMNHLSGKYSTSSLTPPGAWGFPNETSLLAFASSVRGLLEFAAPAFDGVGLPALASLGE